LTVSAKSEVPPAKDGSAAPATVTPPAEPAVPVSLSATTPSPEATAPAPPAAPAGPSLLERLFGFFASTEAEKSPASDTPAAPGPAAPTMAEPSPPPAAEPLAGLTLSAKSEVPPAKDEGAPSKAAAPPSEPTPPVSPPAAPPPSEAALPAPSAAPAGPSLLERLFGLFASTETEKSPTGDTSAPPGPLMPAKVEQSSLPAIEPPASPIESAKTEVSADNDDGTLTTAMARAPVPPQPALTELPLPVIGKIRGPDNPAPEPLPPPSVPSPVPEPSIAAPPAAKPDVKPPPAAPAATDTAATPVAVVTAPSRPKPIPRREPLRDVTLALGDTMVLGRPLMRDRLPAQSCIERRSWPAVFCVEPVDWPADVAALFTVNASLYRGAMAVVRYEPEGAVHYHAIFPTESFAAVTAYLERLHGPPTEQGERMMAVVGQPRQPNPMMRWVSVDGTTRDTAVLEVRAFDDVRNFLPDTSFGVIRLFRENARPVFDILNPSDLLLLRMRQSAVRANEEPIPAKTGPAKR
jgi:hypothetical protein